MKKLVKSLKQLIQMWLKRDQSVTKVWLKMWLKFSPLLFLNWISVQRINKVEKGVLCILCSLFCEKWLLSLSSSFCFNGVVCKAATIFFFILLLKYIWAQNSFLQEQSHPKCSFVHLLLLLASALHTKHYTQWLKIHHKKSHSTKKKCERCEFRWCFVIKSKLKLQRWRFWLVWRL